MPRLLSQILLAVLMFPLGFMVYVAVYAMFHEHFGWDWRVQSSIVAGCVTWAFAGVYWFYTWAASIPWNGRRTRRTLISVAVALAAGLLLGGMGWFAAEDVGALIGSITAPLAWLAAAVIAWRETDEERAKRLGNVSADQIVCPTCDYNLTGLQESRCPECGAQFTLGELLASQPGREANVLR